MSGVGAAVPPKKKSAQELAAEASITAALAQARERRYQARIEYDEATKAHPMFVRHFREAIEAVMQDFFEPASTRVLAWVQRYSWGEYSLFAISVESLPKHQVDCARELGMTKATVSKAVAYLQRRGYLAEHPKLLMPVIAPALRSPDPEAPTVQWSSFFELWKVAHSSDFAELEVARSVVFRIRKSARSEYKKWREQETKRRASLLESAGEMPEEGLGSEVSSPFQESVARAMAKKAKPVSQEAGTHAKAQSFLFTEIQRMQAEYPHSTFSQVPIDPRNPDHQNLIGLILKALGGYDEEYLVGYVVWVAANFRGLGTDHKGISRERAPGTSSGPKGLGLLVNWAEDYARVSGGQKG